MYQLTIKPGQLTLAQLRQISRAPVQVSLDPSCFDDIHASTELSIMSLQKAGLLMALILALVCLLTPVSRRKISKRCNVVSYYLMRQVSASS